MTKKLKSKYRASKLTPDGSLYQSGDGKNRRFIHNRAHGRMQKFTGALTIHDICPSIGDYVHEVCEVNQNPETWQTVYGILMDFAERPDRCWNDLEWYKVLEVMARKYTGTPLTDAQQKQEDLLSGDPARMKRWIPKGEKLQSYAAQGAGNRRGNRPTPLSAEQVNEWESVITP